MKGKIRWGQDGACIQRGELQNQLHVTWRGEHALLCNSWHLDNLNTYSREVGTALFGTQSSEKVFSQFQEDDAL